MNCFVTEGAQDLGAGIVLGLLAAGHNVAFTHFQRDDAAKALLEDAKQQYPNAICRAYPMDLRDPADVDQTITQVLDEFENIEIIVNHAENGQEGPVTEMSLDAWNDVIGTHLNGPFYVCRQFMTALLSNRFGRIVNLSSIYAGGGKNLANYAAAKAGLSGLTKTIAKEYGRKGITANVLTLGNFERETAALTSERKGFWKKYCPSQKGRPGRVDELVGMILYLASDAGGYVNGQVIALSGGLDWGS